jgi:predicted nucleic acid-binding protein
LVFSLDEPVIIKTIQIRKATKAKLPDAIIAATALVNQLVLITRNTKDFTGIDGLKMLDPYTAPELQSL